MHTPPDQIFSRRDLLRLLAASPAVAAAVPAAADRGGDGGRPRTEPLEPTAGRWIPWLLPAQSSFRPGPPPRAAWNLVRREIREIVALQKETSPAVEALIAFWDAQAGVPVWTQALLDTIQATATDPVRASRALALVHTAMADALIACWEAKLHYRRLGPARLDGRVRLLSHVSPQLPSYPSEHAAVAAAASTVLNYLYPGTTVTLHGEPMTFHAAASECMATRLAAGAALRSDLDPGFRLGQAAAFLAVQRGQSDGSAAVWNSTTQPGRLAGPGHWEPTPPANAFPPLHPLAGSWTPWLMESGVQFRAPLPPAMQGEFPSPALLAEAAEVKATVDNLTPDQRTIALYWADNPGASPTPPGHWVRIASGLVTRSGWSAPRAARALALLSAGLADAAICCWDTKYAYWVMRPVTAIRTLTGQPFYDPAFLTPIPTPPFPAYTSGHSTFSGMAATVLESLFPGATVPDAFGNSVSFQQAAEQAAMSRLYGGIHFRSDNEVGLLGGQMVAQLVLARARRDRAPSRG